MSKANINTWDGFIGRVGDTVTYIRMGKLVRRKIGKSTKPATEPQLKHRQRVRITNKFIAPVKEFIQVGLKTEGQMLRKTPNDLMLSYTLSQAIRGEYPDQEIDFAKAQFSKGTMSDTTGLKVTQNEEGLEFTWDTGTIPAQGRRDDQLMVLVYFPDLKKADFDTQAVKRLAGKFQFDIPGNEKPARMETYMAFISADRKTVSNSVYTGQFILPAYEESK